VELNSPYAADFIVYVYVYSPVLPLVIVGLFLGPTHDMYLNVNEDETKAV
jgi:hypothetical protein